MLEGSNMILASSCVKAGVPQSRAYIVACKLPDIARLSSYHDISGFLSGDLRLFQHVSRASVKALKQNGVIKENIINIYINTWKKFFLYRRTQAFGRNGKHTPSNEKKITELLFHTVNTGRILNITTGSDQFDNEGRKKILNVFTSFLYSRFAFRCVLSTHLHVSSRVLCSVFKTRSLNFFNPNRSIRGTWEFICSCRRNLQSKPRRLIKVGAGEKKIQTWTQKSVLAARDVTLMRWPDGRKYLEKQKREKQK